MIPRTAYTVPKRSHLLVLAALCFLCGCLSALFLTDGLWLWATLAAAVVSLVLFRLAGRSGLAAAVFCFFLLGVMRTDAAMNVPQPVPGKYEICATVSGGATQRTDQRITFALTDIVLDGCPVQGKAYCSLHYENEPPELFDGARLRFTGRVYLPDGKSGEPHPDFRLWMRQRGFSFDVTTYQEVTIENTPFTAPVVDLSHRIRSSIHKAYERVMGDNARIAMAMLFSSREGLRDEENKAFQELGIAHVLSVSGLHVSVLSTLLMFLFKRLELKKKLHLPLLSVFLIGYCGLTGFSAAANRAAIMLVCFMFARSLHRKADRLNVLACSMLVILLLQPLQAYSAGFVLSFSAMMGLLLFTRPIRNFLLPEGYRHPRLYRWICDGLSVSIAAQLGVLLPTAAYFNQLPLYGILINLVIVPLVSGVLLPCYAALLPVSIIPLLGRCAGWIVSRMTDVLLWLVKLLSHLPYASIRVPSPPAVFCIGMGLAVFMLSRRMPGSLRKRIAAAVLTLIVAVCATIWQLPAEVRYIQLDSGQADCALLLDGRTTILIDAGSDGQNALDYLMAESRDIDALYITHLHMDHIGGMEQLLDSPVRIHQVYLPVNAQHQRVDPEALALLEKIHEKNIPTTYLAMGDELRYNKTAVRVLWPNHDVRTGHPANEMPLVLSINLDGYTILSSSDLEGFYETYAAIPADVLKVAHHGSSNSTSADFLHFVSPAFALVSVSSGNHYLPGEETLNRLEQAGVQVFRTDECGDITLTVQNGALCATPYQTR